MWRPDVGDFLATAAEVLGVSEDQLRRLPGLPLAESALAAPFAGFGDQDAYPTLELKAAVLLERLVRNHPLPDGNKRTALAMTIDFLELNGCAWREPDVDVDVEAVRRVAAGEAELEEIVAWIRRRLAP
jgi:death-on-curing protein